MEDVGIATEIQHTIVRECLKLFNIKKGIEIVTISDVPMKGTGLGSSSSLTVGLINALAAYKGKILTPDDLVTMAWHVENEILKAPIGKQDQCAAVFGGLNHFVFGKDGSVTRSDLYQKCSSIKVKWLDESTMLFYLDMPREGNHILADQVKDIEAKKKAYDAMKELTHDFMKWLEDGFNSSVAGRIIDTAWQTKKSLCGRISNTHIDNIYSMVLTAGAIGGKLCGAGGGGFLMLMVPKDYQSEVVKAMRPLKQMPFNFDEEGSRVIYHER